MSRSYQEGLMEVLRVVGRALVERKLDGIPDRRATNNGREQSGTGDSESRESRS